MAGNLSSRVGYSHADVQRITLPAIVVPGLENNHPQHTAEALHSILPHSELVVFADHFSSDETEQLREWCEAGEGPRYVAALAPILDGFIQRVEMNRN